MYEIVTQESNINTIMFLGEGSGRQGTMIECNNWNIERSDKHSKGCCGNETLQQHIYTFWGHLLALWIFKMYCVLIRAHVRSNMLKQSICGKSLYFVFVEISAAWIKRASWLIMIQGLLAKHMNRQADASAESGLVLVATYPFCDYRSPLLGLVMM